MTAAPPPDDRHLPDPEQGQSATAARPDGGRRAPLGAPPSDAALALLAEVIAFEAAVMGHAMRRPAPVRLAAAARWRRERELLDEKRMGLRDCACRLPAAQFAPFDRPRL